MLGAGGFASLLQNTAFAAVETEADPKLLCNEEDGEVYLIGQRQGRVTIKVAKQNQGIETMSLLTEDIPQNDRIPVHIHHNEEEFIYVQSGEGIFTFGDKEYDVGPGAFVLVPRGVWHGLQNKKKETIRMVFGYTPAGFEDYFRAIGVAPGQPPKNLTAEDWNSINEKYGVTYR